MHVVAGMGSLAWFTLLWPAPAVFNPYRRTYAFDDPANAACVSESSDGRHIYVRRSGARILWQGTGAHALPTVFVAGTNQAHTSTPSMTRLASGTEIVAAGAVLQSALGAPIPVIVFARAPYGPAPGASAPIHLSLADVPCGVATEAAHLEMIGEALELSLDLPVSWGVDGGTPASIVELARRLAFTAKAFAGGLTSTVVMPAMNDDPHGAWASGDAEAGARADALTRVLDGFYVELARHPEPAAVQHHGLSLADNVVMIVSGDTPKNPFQRNDWPDEPPGRANLIYVRSNGFLKSGWFGAITPDGRTLFDPTTGDDSVVATEGAATAAAHLGILFAIACGDASAVSRVSDAPYSGVINKQACLRQ